MVYTSLVVVVDYICLYAIVAKYNIILAMLGYLAKKFKTMSLLNFTI